MRQIFVYIRIIYEGSIKTLQNVFLYTYIFKILFYNYISKYTPYVKLGIIDGYF